MEIQLDTQGNQTANLQDALRQFTGTEHYYRHPLVPTLLYTDGVKYFAEEAKAYWFLDELAFELTKAKYANQAFISVSLIVSDNQCDIVATDGNSTTLWQEHVSYTNCPSGEYRFYFTDNVVLVNHEY